MSEWANENRILETKTSPLPGPWRTHRTPYLREPMDAFRTRHVDKITLCFGTQLGKSEALLNMIGYAIDQDPGSMLVVYPTDELAKSIAKNRLIPMVVASEALLSKWDPDRTEILEVQFMGMYIALVGANSPSKLASRPVRYIFYDETDKFPAYSGNEGSPTELASERAKNFHNRKEVEASSPTYTDGHIWKAFLEAEVRKNFFVPCPHCRQMQTLKLQQIRWPEELNESEHKHERDSRVLTEAWYECPFCHERIHDMDKSLMLLQGEWWPVRETKDRKLERTDIVPARPRHVAYNLSSLYSPWLTFGQVAQKFLSTKGDQAKFMNFVNGWLAEPWEAEATKLRSDIVLERQADHLRGDIPAGAILLTCGIDVQMDHFWWTVRAWGPKMTSWLVDFGRCETWAELDDMLDHEYTLPTGDPVLIHVAFMDSGNRTDEVYQYCATRTGLVYPCKGASNRMPRAPFSESRVDRDGYNEMHLFIVDTHYYKSFIAGRLNKKNHEPGAFLVFRDEDGGWLRQYAEQLCSEHLVKEQDKKGHVKDVWKPVVSGAANHLLDCEVYAAAAAERAGVRYLREEEIE